MAQLYQVFQTAVFMCFLQMSAEVQTMLADRTALASLRAIVEAQGQPRLPPSSAAGGPPSSRTFGQRDPPAAALASVSGAAFH
jgi:hypothetical protein